MVLLNLQYKFQDFSFTREDLDLFKVEQLEESWSVECNVSTACGVSNDDVVARNFEKLVGEFLVVSILKNVILQFLNEFLFF